MPIGLRLVVAVALALASGCKAEEPQRLSPAKHAPRDHRSSAPACPVDAPMGRPDRALDGCVTDGQCKEGKLGRCNARHLRGRDGGVNACSYDACYADADCPPHRVCVCARGDMGARHYCADEGDCLVDADCGPSAFGPPFCSPSRGYRCHTPRDLCTDERDCDAGELCDFDGASRRWSCHR